MRIILDLERSLEENAATYFERAKKARRKQAGAQEALAATEKRLQTHEAAQEAAQLAAALATPKRHWYHKYRWSKTRNGHLLVAGQNASANETLVKHHAEPEDIVFHTDMAGSPFTLLKAQEGVLVTEEDLLDAAQLTVAYSQAWKRGMAQLEAFSVRPEQVTKTAQSGEFLPKGAFMIRGATHYHEPRVQIAIGVITREGVQPEVFVGSEESCAQHCTQYVPLLPGDTKTSDAAKTLARTLGGDSNDYLKAIPPGGVRLGTIRQRTQRSTPEEQ